MGKKIASSYRRGNQTLYFLFEICSLITLKFNRDAASFPATVGLVIREPGYPRVTEKMSELWSVGLHPLQRILRCPYNWIESALRQLQVRSRAWCWIQLAAAVVNWLCVANWVVRFSACPSIDSLLYTSANASLICSSVQIDVGLFGFIRDAEGSRRSICMAMQHHLSTSSPLSLPSSSAAAATPDCPMNRQHNSATMYSIHWLVSAATGIDDNGIEVRENILTKQRQYSA